MKKNKLKTKTMLYRWTDKKSERVKAKEEKEIYKAARCIREAHLEYMNALIDYNNLVFKRSSTIKNEYVFSAKSGR